MPKLLALFLLLACTLNAYAGAKLIFAADLIRHGDRTPYHPIPNDPISWSQGLGQLTPLGMQQEYNLGEKKRKLLINEKHLLPKQYHRKIIFIRSTNFDRTLMSANSFLYALYPLGTGPNLLNKKPALPEEYQPVPVHTLPKNKDTLLVHGIANPQQFQMLLTEIVKTSAFQKRQAELQPKFAKWTKSTGMPIHSLMPLIELGDNLLIRNIYHKPLPKGLTQADANEIIATMRWLIVTTYKNPSIGHFAGDPLIKKIIHDIHDITQNKSPLKYELFSGHDTTILAVMSALGVPLEEPPPYASNIEFQLLQESDGKRFVTITYNDKPVTIPKCGGTQCNLQQLSEIIKTN